jgi:hypothetical protein
MASRSNPSVSLSYEHDADCVDFTWWRRAGGLGSRAMLPPKPEDDAAEIAALERRAVEVAILQQQGGDGSGAVGAVRPQTERMKYGFRAPRRELEDRAATRTTTLSFPARTGGTVEISGLVQDHAGTGAGAVRVAPEDMKNRESSIRRQLEHIPA